MTPFHFHSLRVSIGIGVALMALGSWPAYAAGNPIELASTPRDGDFDLVAGGTAATIVVDEKDARVVRTVAKCLANDVEIVTGRAPKVVAPSGTTPKHAVLIGTIGQSAPIDALIASGKLEVRAIEGKWESFGIAIVSEPFPGMESALVIAGSDRRGTAYGVFALSETIGVSPWGWWADVTPAHRDELALRGGPFVQGPPSVKYRGIFINDEDWSLQPWAAKTFEPETGDIGPKTYAKVCELLLRLKANYLWPAMHSCTRAFNHYPNNKLVADEYGIVMGSSHCEQMLRNNVDEYHEEEMGPWDYERNRDHIIDYWRERVEENSPFENIYTVGMRGIHDSGMPGGGSIDQKVSRLSGVIRDQRRILAEFVDPDPSRVPQIFCPYKEVLTLYQNGLEVPDDITIVWPDDNYGFIRQLPDADEQQRSGGSGIYYHVSYWGSPNDYLWLCTTPPALIWEEMNKAYAWNARRLWVVNVGGLKKAEVLMDFFLRYAWNVESVPSGPDENGIPVAFDQTTALQEFAARIFGDEIAGDIAGILDEFYRLNLGGKPEFLHKDAVHFSFDAYDEAQQRLARFAQLVRKVDQVAPRIEPRLEDAYYELVVFPVRAAAMRNEIMLNARRYDELKSSSAEEAERYAAQARYSYDELKEEVRHFNEDVADGKWQHVMPFNPRNLEQWRGPRVPDNGAASDALRNGAEAALVAQDATRPGVRMARNGVVSIPADQPTDVGNNGRYHWEIIDGLSRSLTHNAITVLPPTQPSFDAGRIQDAPSLTYDFESGSEPPEVGVVVHLLPTLPVNPTQPLRYAVAVDDGSPQVVDIAERVPGESGWERGDWSDNVMRAAAIHRTTHQISKSAKHAVRIWSLDPGIVLEKIVIDLGGLEASVQGPPFE